jgi:hypothetical protein
MQQLIIQRSNVSTQNALHGVNYTIFFGDEITQSALHGLRFTCNLVSEILIGAPHQ